MSKRTLLLVDDEVLIAMAQQHSLEALGYRVLIAHRSSDTLARIQEHPEIDLVLMDINLAGGENGGDLARALLETREVPVVFLSSFTDSEAMEKISGSRSYGYVAKSSGIAVLDGSIRMAFRLHEAFLREREQERQLRESEARYRTLAQHFPNGLISLYDRELRYLTADGEGLQSSGISSADFIGKTMREIFPPEVYDRDEPALLAALDGRTTDAEVPYGPQTHRVITAPVRDEEGSVVGGMVVTQEITSIVETRERLQSTLDELSLAVDTANLGIWRLNIESGALFWNDCHLAIYGVTREEFEQDLNAWRSQVHPDDRAYAESRLNEVIEGKDVFGVEFRIRRRDGAIRHVSASGRPIIRDGKVVELIGVNVDVTEQKERESALSQALKDRDLLLRETHHRVKNNLLTVDALLMFSEASAGVSLAAVRSQINAIRTVHELLHSSQTGTGIPAADYLGRIISSVITTVSADRLQIVRNIDDVHLGTDVAVPVGLIVNELLTNAVQHGFRPDTDRQLELALSCSEDGPCTIEVANSGEPFPDDVTLDEPPSLGLRLIAGLVEQIQGSISLEREPITRFTIRFPQSA